MISNFSDEYCCPACSGTGLIPLTGVYADTLKTIRELCRKRDDFIVANKHFDWFGCEPTALNNRLVWLEKNGFIFSERFGRQRRFYLCVTGGRK